MNKSMNPLLLCDSYKLGHADQYPVGTEYIFSNFTPRSLKHAIGSVFSEKLDKIIPEKNIVVFGLQAVLKDMVEIWDNGFFKKDKAEVVNEFLNAIRYYVDEKTLMKMKERVSALHDYGKLPIKVNALDEGTLVSVKVPVFTICNTEKEFYWITNYLETWLSANLWKVMTSATIAHVYRQIVDYFAKETGVYEQYKDFIDWQCHDFSMRGMSGIHDAKLTGLGHLTSFTGSDTLIAAKYAQEMYGDELCNDYLYAGSVPATEHSVMCLGSAVLDEKGLFKNLITQVYPSGVVSIVSDTWDYWKVITEYLPELKTTVLKRDGKLVIRPDSGNPVHIIAGYKIQAEFDNFNALTNDAISVYRSYQENPLDDKCVVYVTEQDTYYQLKDVAEHDSEGLDFVKIEKHIVQGSIQTLWNVFGGTVSIGLDGKEYKTLDSHIGLIYGDSITTERCYEILSRLKERGFSSVNVVFGVGSYTYNYHSRDTLGFAMKATYGVVNGVGYNVFKAPKTDSDNMKKSATGLLRVVNGVLEEQYQLKDNETVLTYNQGQLHTVFNNGEFVKTTNLEEIRSKLKQ